VSVTLSNVTLSATTRVADYLVSPVVNARQSALVGMGARSSAVDGSHGSEVFSVHLVTLVYLVRKVHVYDRY
jgi:hypothetical protein